MLGLLSLQAASIMNIELDITAMAAIAIATPLELECAGDYHVSECNRNEIMLDCPSGATPPVTTTYTHSTVSRGLMIRNLQHLTLHILVNEIRHREDKRSGNPDATLSNVLLAFLSRLDVRGLKVMLKVEIDHTDSKTDGENQTDTSEAVCRALEDLHDHMLEASTSERDPAAQRVDVEWERTLDGDVWDACRKRLKDLFPIDCEAMKRQA